MIEFNAQVALALVVMAGLPNMGLVGPIADRLDAMDREDVAHVAALLDGIPSPAEARRMIAGIAQGVTDPLSPYFPE